MAKEITIKQALKLFKNGDEIVFGMAANEPKETIENIHRLVDEKKLKEIHLTSCLSTNKDAKYLDEKYRNNIFLSSFFYDPALRKANPNGNATYIPNHLHLAAKNRFSYKTYDYFISVASMPDEHGYVSIPMGNVYEKAAHKNAKYTILEINPNFPRTFGDNEINLKEVDYIIKTNYNPPVMPEIPLTAKDKKIGKLIADQIEDESCIQLGIGGIPNAVAEALKDKKDLGIHTEMFTSNMVELINSGVVNGKKKQLLPEKHICAFAYGSKKMYDFMNNNPSVLVLNCNWVNDPYVIGKNNKQVSINSAIEISLDGQVASESIGTRQFSGTGGQVDTVVGAQNSKGGKSFIALYSTAMVKNKKTGKREEKSKIVPILTQGATVSLSRNDVDMVVTEYGIAHLKGRSVKEKAIALINISHPKFKPSLKKEALNYGLLTENDLKKIK